MLHPMVSPLRTQNFEVAIFENYCKEKKSVAMFVEGMQDILTLC